ncbi:uncharacterized protein LOC125470820 [Pyrus x bretschneideri]|uniref:uncharacterized protein LOC125470820 n=1 Tax=Pyrus x bretschneideri TaxID=225117 RepID=UPI00202F46E9|nr:uncharacterized protein LOC125470820 [Pyrus x bretschneideri]
MDGMNDHERAIAWLWAIEALASFKQVDASLLHDLIAMAPTLPEDIGNNATERVALKCLESLFSPCNVMSSDVPSSQHSKIGFNLSETCENVLKRIVNETPQSDLRTGGPGVLKWDIHPFIMHKTASLPNCALKQLKDSILAGTHPHADFLRKKGGLTLTSDGDRVPLGESNPRLNESCSNAQNMGIKGSTDPLNIEHESKQLEEDPDNANLLPSKRNRIASDARIMADENRSSVNVSDDWNIISKKMKCDASYVLQSTEQNQIRLHGKELLGDLSERERCDCAENQMGTMDGSTALENGCDDCTSSNGYGQSNGDAVHKSQSENHLNATSMPQDKSLDEAHQYSCADQTKHDSCLHPEPRASSVAPPDGIQNKVSAKVFNFNSEHNFHSADGPQEKSISENGNGLVAKNLADENHKSVIGSDETLHKVSAEVFNRNSELGILVKVSLPASTDEPQQKSIADEGKDDEHFPEPRASSIVSLDETQHDSSSENDSHIKVAHPASTDESPEKSIADEARELLDWLCHYESEISTDSVEFHDEED